MAAFDGTHEREARTLADRVLTSPDSSAAPGEDTGHHSLALRRAVSGSPTPTSGVAARPCHPLQAVNSALRSPGKALDAPTTSFFEPRFEHDFRKVRIFDDGKAHAAADAVHAEAFTVGNSIVFGRGRFAPHSTEGRRLLAHELAHVVQATPGVLLRQKKKSYLKEEGITGARTVDDAARVREVIQKTLADPNSKLYPYIKGKLATLAKDGTGLKIEDTAVFASHYRKHAKRQGVSVDPSIRDEDLVREVGGFFDPKTQTIFLKLRSSYCEAFHEAIHSLSLPTFLMTWLGRDLMEGLTQYFTDVVFVEQTGSKCSGHKYGKQLGCAEKLVDSKGIGFDAAARLFFQNDLSALDALVTRLKLKDKTELLPLGSDGICRAL